MSPFPLVEEFGWFGFALLGVLFPALLASILARIAWRRNGRRRLFFAVAAIVTAGIAVAAFNTLVHRTVAAIYRSQADTALAEENFTGARNLYLDSLAWVDDVDVRDLLARSLMGCGEYRLAHAVLFDAIRRRDGRPTAQEGYLLGLHAFFVGNAGVAVARLEPIVDHLEYGWDARLLLAVLYLDQDRFDAARQLLMPFQSVAPTRLDHLYSLARLASHDRNASEVRSLLGRLPDGPLPDFWKQRFDRLKTGPEGVEASPTAPVITP